MRLHLTAVHRDHPAMVAMDPESMRRDGTYDDINLNRPLLTPTIQGQARSLKLRLSSQFPVNAFADILM